MPKSYRITLPRTIQSQSFALASIVLDRQGSIEGVPASPQTKIYRARTKISLDDFESFIIEHEMEEEALGRYNTSVFTKFIRKELIHSYYSKRKEVFLLSGKKRFVVDFCKKSNEFAALAFDEIKVDMGKLLAQLPHIKGVWFKFSNGLIRASALMGANIESTPDFQNYSLQGDISTLSFFFDYNGMTHPVMVVNDGTVVLYLNYAEVTDEIELVVTIKDTLLSEIMEIVKSSKLSS
jgi:hypothetical protein